jgi:hypothetical protein
MVRGAEAVSAAALLRAWSRRLLGWVRARAGRWTSWRRPRPARSTDAWHGLAVQLALQDRAQRALALPSIERACRSIPEGVGARGLVTGERASAAEVLLCLLRQDSELEIPQGEEEWIAWDSRSD